MTRDPMRTAFLLFTTFPGASDSKCGEKISRVRIKEAAANRRSEQSFNDGNFWRLSKACPPPLECFHVNKKPTSSCFHSNLIKDVQTSLNVVLLEVVEPSDDSDREREQQQGRKNFLITVEQPDGWWKTLFIGKAAVLSIRYRESCLNFHEIELSNSRWVSKQIEDPFSRGRVSMATSIWSLKMCFRSPNKGFRFCNRFLSDFLLTICWQRLMTAFRSSIRLAVFETHILMRALKGFPTLPQKSLRHHHRTPTKPPSTTALIKIPFHLESWLSFVDGDGIGDDKKRQTSRMISRRPSRFGFGAFKASHSALVMNLCQRVGSNVIAPMVQKFLIRFSLVRGLFHSFVRRLLLSASSRVRPALEEHFLFQRAIIYAN